METTLPLMLDGIARKYPDIPAQYFRINEKTPVFESLSYRELMNIALNFAGGLLSLGVRRGDPVGLIADNRREWLQMDMGIMAIGAVDVPRGCDAVESELGFILASTECGTVIAENAAQVCKILALKSQLPKLQQIITMDTVEDPEVIALVRKHAVGLFAFEEVQKAGIEYNQKNPGLAEEEMRKGCGDDLACIIFTSGTTGEPKGVMLTHHNFLAQLDELPERIYLHPGDRALLVLPVWHVFERLCEYVIICQGGSLCYSKPIGSVMLPDMQELNPQLMPAVPRVFEAVYEAVNRTMRKTGGVVFVLYKFFLGAAKLQSAIHRRLFRKTARFRNDHILLSW
ncbi:MAG: AMP-binding protein, partial [Spirochaetaceae bacterium]|nr:AMP-binding protein [Spirochaetaceae bacterium]